MMLSEAAADFASFSRTPGSAREEAQRLRHISKVYTKLNRHEAAVFHAKEAVEISRGEDSSPVDLARSLAQLGEAHAIAGHRASARSVLEDARHVTADVPEGSERDEVLALIAAASDPTR